MSAILELRQYGVEVGAGELSLRVPLILEQGGRPVAVILTFDEYERLRQSALSDQERREAAWSKLMTLLDGIHRRPASLSPEQIEAEITLARDEVRITHRESADCH